MTFWRLIPKQRGTSDATLPHPGRAFYRSPDTGANLASFARHLRAENKAPSTIVTYAKAVEQFDTFLAAVGMPRAVANIHREHVLRGPRALPNPGERWMDGKPVGWIPTSWAGEGRHRH